MNRSLLLVILLFLFPSAQFHAQTGTSKTQPANQTNPEAESLYLDGVERLEMGQVTEALERFQKALKIDPEYIEAYSALGRAFFKLRQWDNASATFRRALALKAQKRNNADNKTLALVRNTPLDQRPPANSNVATQQTKVNKPLPALPINAASAVTTLGSALIPPQVSRSDSGARANIRFDDLLGSPPPELREKAADTQVAINVTPLPPPVESKITTTVSPTSLTEDTELTTIYRVGSQDVLEIKLNSSQPPHATVFKVTQSGLLEHPQLSGPLPVTGLTVEEISARIENDLKNQASIENPKAFVGVVEYASHSIVVDGLVKSPGTKSLKSEAIPLAIVVAEAQPLSEAARVTVVRNGDQILETDLNSTADTRLLVRPGDVVTLHPQMNAVIHVSGKVKFPGEKTYRFGLTLTQAIIMAGGPTSNSSMAEIVRGGDEAVRTRFDLKAIMAGKAADPLIKAGDRIILQ